MNGKVVVITGASSGIGEATALLLASRGAKLVLGARRTDRLEALASKTGAAYARTDVSKREDLAELVRIAQEQYGRLDVMVSNAGIAPNSRLDALQVDAWDRMIDVNLKGVLYGIAAALPVFQAQGSGHFVTTASTAAYRIVPTMAVYAATKTAVRVVAEGLRQEAGDNIRVTTISPGYIATDFGELIGDPEVRAQALALKEKIAIPADSIAQAVAYAISQPPEVDVNEIVIRPTAQS
jgi:NADP-dependent 3-hydroxy acid dehydrogenase YdfG